jgi:hypothetical protein
MNPFDYDFSDSDDYDNPYEEPVEEGDEGLEDDDDDDDVPVFYY